MEQEVVLKIRQDIRTHAIAGRDALDSGLRHKWSSEIIERLRDYLFEKLAAANRSIHCYISFRSEVETRAFIERALQEGTRVTVPVIERSETSNVLGHTEIMELKDLVKGRFGLEAPVVRNPATPAAMLHTLDAVIVPLVAFDRCGTRLGYGMGFYDRFLRELPRSVERIGLAFSMQEVDDIPILPHDEPLDTIVTEQAIIKASPAMHQE